MSDQRAILAEKLNRAAEAYQRIMDLSDLNPDPAVMSISGAMVLAQYGHLFSEASYELSRPQ